MRLYGPLEKKELAMILDPVPPIHSDITIVIDDSCNSCCCIPWIRSKSPTKKIEDIAKKCLEKKAETKNDFCDG